MTLENFLVFIPLIILAFVIGLVLSKYLFKQKEDYVRIIIDIKGLSKNHKHGFHIHESGDLREGCKSCCAHYNPSNTEQVVYRGVPKASNAGSIVSES